MNQGTSDCYRTSSFSKLLNEIQNLLSVTLKLKEKMCFVLISVPFFGSLGEGEGRGKKKQCFSFCNHHLSPHYEISAMCC